MSYPLNLIEELAGNSYTIPVGTNVVVLLGEEPALSGKWYYHPSFLELIDEEKKYYGPNDEDRKFTLHAHVAGQADLTFDYKTGETFVRSVVFHITAQ